MSNVSKPRTGLRSSFFLALESDGEGSPFSMDEVTLVRRKQKTISRTTISLGTRRPDNEAVAYLLRTIGSKIDPAP
jgi:hypothetical protein